MPSVCDQRRGTPRRRRPQRVPVRAGIHGARGELHAMCVGHAQGTGRGAQLYAVPAGARRGRNTMGMDGKPAWGYAC